MNFGLQSIPVNEIVMAVTGILRERCQCNFTSNLIDATRVSCPHSKIPAIIFRAEIYGTLRATAYNLSRILQEWTRRETSTIVVSSIEYLVMNFCSAPTNASIEEVCKITTNTPEVANTPEVTSTPGVTSTPEATKPEGTNLEVIVGGAAGVACVLILAVVSGIVICFIAYSKIRHPPEDIR